tara:strand:+ start:37 stop:750 length:714 start_codon:yes stop_codon:yes gene_type:complete
VKKNKNSKTHNFLTNIEKEKKFFISHGYLHIKNLLNKKKLIKVRKDCKIFSKKKNIKKYPVHDIHKYVTSAYSFIKNKKIKLVVKNLIKSKELHGIQSAFFSTSKNESGIPPHQDDFFIKAGLNNTMNIWVPLVDVSSKNGTLAIYLRSHKNGVNKKYNLIGLKNNNRRKLNPLKKYSLKKLKCKIGDVVFICNQVFHEGGYNSISKKRYILSFTYLKDKKKFNPGKSANRKKFKIS